MEKKGFKSTPEYKKLTRFWKRVKPIAVVVVSVCIIVLISYVFVSRLFSRYLDPVDKYDPTPIQVVIPESSSASKIARILYTARGEDEKGLITNTAVFKIYVDFVGKSSSLQAGTYILSRNMSIKQIVDTICKGNSKRTTVKFTIPEGFTSDNIADLFVENGLVDTTSSFLTACNNKSDYQTFDFIKSISDHADARNCLLEGYLFPDTYDAYLDSDINTVIVRLLNRFNEVFTDEYKQKAEELGFSVDDIVILASLIEKEAQISDDFSKVSAVFHNRLKQNMALQSCASLSYALNVKQYTFTEEQLKTKSLYNTYMYTGLPAGPICNPGKKAIEAALYPNEEYLNEDYLYFCNGNIELSSELIFSKTYEEHQKNVELYQEYWN